MKRLILLLILPIHSVFSQSIIELDSCYTWAQENYPGLKQTELWKEITTLKQDNLSTSYYPRVTLNGQITYQSEVITIDIPMAGVYIPTVTKDRYNAFAELQQNIWDGGISSANKTLEEAVLNCNLSKLEVELYKLNEQVAQTFFTSLIADKQKAVILAQKEALTKQLETVKSGIQNGFIERSTALVLQAEILKLEQNTLELQAMKDAAIQMLALLTGKSLTNNSTLNYNSSSVSTEPIYFRPEFQLFSDQIYQLSTQKELLTKTRNPKLFGFGQLGYGKPGLNMLLDEFKGYYLVGVGVSWKAFDWKNASRQKEVLELHQQIIKTHEKTFTRNLELLLIQQSKQINKLNNMLDKDKQLVEIRTDITVAAESKFKNETITASDYIREVQAETISKLNYELHKIQFNEAQEKYSLIKGKN